MASRFNMCARALSAFSLIALPACGPTAPAPQLASTQAGVNRAQGTSAASLVHLHAVKVLIEDRIPHSAARCERRDRQLRTTFLFDPLSEPPATLPRAAASTAGSYAALSEQRDALPPPELEEAADVTLPAAIARSR